MNNNAPQAVHMGRNIKRIREILQVKQATLATLLGDDWNQKKISQLEDRESIVAPLLIDVANALKVSPEAIEEYKEDAAINIVANTIHNKDQGCVISYQPTFNPIDKIVELYEALVQSEKDKVALLTKMIDK